MKAAARATPSAGVSPVAAFAAPLRIGRAIPLGTRFRLVESGEEYIIDDYGGALIGTNTIDLYKQPGAMRRWGVRHVDIDILGWGSEEESLKILRPRKHVRIVRRMIAGLEKKQAEKKTRPSDAASGTFFCTRPRAVPPSPRENPGRRRCRLHRQRLRRVAAQ